jgi:acetylxylan esterase
VDGRPRGQPDAGGAVTATNAGYNATIAPNASIGIGFQATHTGDTGRPAAFRLNGRDCAAG